MKSTKLFSGTCIALVLMTLGTVAVAQNQAIHTLKIDDGTKAMPFNPDALIDMQSANRGLLLPRVLLTATTNPAPLTAHTGGMTVYNLATTADVTPGLYYNDGTKWNKINNSTYDPWALGGNNNTAEKVLGTNNAFDLPFVTAGIERMRVSANGNVGVGTAMPASKLEVNGSATNTTAYNAGTATIIDFSKSNLAYTLANPGAFTLSGMKDGGTYTLMVRGAAAGTSAFTHAGLAFSSANNALTTNGKATMYTFLVLGTFAYYWMTPGF